MLLRFLFCFWSFCLLSWADILTLENDSQVPLNAVIQDATGTVLEEVVIQPGDSTTWSLNYEYYGYNSQPSAPQTPYTVNWYCDSGELFGTCMDVASESTVTALSCGGDQQCGQNGQ
ncbi:MAG TPA: hypothetical protein VGJ00_02020 [Rhabdochlamydiaceae bacterium]|jgi:hypothetical protein